MKKAAEKVGVTAVAAGWKQQLSWETNINAGGKANESQLKAGVADVSLRKLADDIMAYAETHKSSEPGWAKVKSAAEAVHNGINLATNNMWGIRNGILPQLRPPACTPHTGGAGMSAIIMQGVAMTANTGKYLWASPL